MLRVEELWTLDDLEPYRATMRRLAATSAQQSPFATLEVLEDDLASNPCPGRLACLRVLGAFEGGDLVGYLPMRRIDERILGRECTRHQALSVFDDRPHVVAAAGDERRCGEAFWDWLLSWSNGGRRRSASGKSSGVPCRGSPGPSPGNTSSSWASPMSWA